MAPLDNFGDNRSVFEGYTGRVLGIPAASLKGTHTIFGGTYSVFEELRMCLEGPCNVIQRFQVLGEDFCNRFLSSSEVEVLVEDGGIVWEVRQEWIDS